MASTNPSIDSTISVPLTEADQIKGRIYQLQNALQKELPGYEGLLHTIHSNLAKSPDTVHFLSDEEIGIICSGLQKKTQIVISAKENKKSLKGTKLDEL